MENKIVKRQARLDMFANIVCVLAILAVAFILTNPITKTTAPLLYEPVPEPLQLEEMQARGCQLETDIDGNTAVYCER